MKEFAHKPVLLAEAMAALRVEPGGAYLDATVGLGGHAAEMLRRSAPDGRLCGMDKDPQALARAAERLQEFGGRVVLRRGSFETFGEAFGAEAAWDGVLADLGVSSLQLEDPARGFSFQAEGPLDMRMDPDQPETAAEYLRRISPEELEERLREAGEDRFAGRLARRLWEGRDLWRTTADLALAVIKTAPRRGRSHPATRVFLALRMAVNREMEELRSFLERVPARLKPGGRLAVITFHSTEDRIVKRFYGEEHGMRRVTKSPVIPGWEERKGNRRSRSAKLRVFEKI